MKGLKFTLFVFYQLIFITSLSAQNDNYQYLSGKRDTLINEARLYGSLLHQHQDFINKAFSFQGIEGG